METQIKKLKHLGLNERQSRAYIFILESKRIKASDFAKLFRVTIPGATKVLQALRDKGFIKKIAIGNKKIYLPVEIELLIKEKIKKAKRDLEKKESVLEELKQGYGDYSIKTHRVSGDFLMDNLIPLVSKANNVYEFVDLRNVVNFNKPKEYKDVKFTTLYFSNDDKSIEGTKINLDETKNYPHIKAFDNKVSFTLLNKETLVIENEDISNAIKFLIRNSYKKEEQV